MNKPRRIKRPISRVWLLDKPRGFSSNQALQKVRWLYQAEKGGIPAPLIPSRRFLGLAEVEEGRLAPRRLINY